LAALRAPGASGEVCDLPGLGERGATVVVLESLPTAGGYRRSEATVAEAPGFLMNTGGIDHIFTNIGPSVVDELRLGRYGLRYVDIDPLAILGRAAWSRRSLATAVRILVSSPTAVLDEWFEREEVRSVIIAYTSFTNTPIDARSWSATAGRGPWSCGPERRCTRTTSSAQSIRPRGPS
jgi:hypothetical protein